jgi:type II secretory pathway pseudopilin PulG
MTARRNERGVTLLDTLVGIALMGVVFLGIGAAFRLSIDVITNNKARAGAIALVNERMEYIRSLGYTQLGTSGGIPSGALAQSENIVLNGITYTRRTVIEYADDPKDGTGGADTNGITADYKQVKVDVAWYSRPSVRHITIGSRFSPVGIETAVPGGTLVINAVNSSGVPLAGAQVRVVNASTTPTIDETTFTNASGTVTLIGAPAASNYQITVSQAGYSTAQTYSATAQNTNPNPANLTVTNNHTTAGTFAIDLVGRDTIYTWTPITVGSWTDTFADSTKVASSTGISVASGLAKLTGPAPYGAYGESRSIAIGPSLLAHWKTLSWVATVPASTTLRFYVYDGTGTTLIPDGQLPGNSTGFATSPVDLSAVSTSTYPSIRIDALFGTASTSQTPSLDSFAVGYDAGPTPVPNVAFTLRGAKTIGSGPSGTLYKYNQSLTTNASAVNALTGLEWDSYLLTISGTSTGYDISSSCAPQPTSLAPGGTLTTNLYLSPHTTNSLLVDTRSATNTQLLSGMTVWLTRTGFAATSTTDSCGQAFFSNLTSSSAYTVSASSTGYTTVSASTTVGGASTAELLFN